MPYKGCHKARIECTISSINPPFSKEKLKDIEYTSMRQEKTATVRDPAYHAQRNLSTPNLSPQLLMDNKTSFYHEMIPIDTVIMRTGLQVGECYLGNGVFEEYPVLASSGVMTAPSVKGDHEFQIPLHAASFAISRQQNWETENDCIKVSQSSFPSLDRRERWWDQAVLRRLLETNMALLDGQTLVAQELAMLGCIDADIALTNLESASRNVLCDSKRFLEFAKVLIDGQDDRTKAVIVDPESLAANAFVPQVHTPVDSGRLSYGSVASFTSSLICQSPWQGIQSEDTQVPLILSIANCYSCLVGSYHMILTYLLHELMAVTISEQRSQSSTFSGLAAAQVQRPDRDSRL
ncbi:hypothetical protein BGW36DRAFT_466233 [Talaromyces proteolyticus]|uniref:Uncharacterized protein n=1 Tax=Talaromyces proteolyticus TaxID=1131652 RepID=A0AAD4KD62_9EURO|nr:uncharacterized protein BGW36DRAFT_466233 [Talaromyces proteolyticus]KAH8689301.1 hypothetical protein BGW36DRAFT_466233 [Talaromyces proteolyticus]